MLDKLVEYGKQLFALTSDIKQCKEDIKQLRQDLKEVNQRLDRLTEVMQRFAYEVQRDRENAEKDRKILLLEIDNRFLRFERRLPPGSPQTDEPET